MGMCRFFLPPIILYAGLSVRKKSFFANFATIASLGIAGTYVAFSVIAAFLLIVAVATKFITLTRAIASFVHVEAEQETSN